MTRIVDAVNIVTGFTVSLQILAAFRQRGLFVQQEQNDVDRHQRPEKQDGQQNLVHTRPAKAEKAMAMMAATIMAIGLPAMGFGSLEI